MERGVLATVAGESLMAIISIRKQHKAPTINLLSVIIRGILISSPRLLYVSSCTNAKNKIIKDVVLNLFAVKLM